MSEERKMSRKYDSIIALPHHISAKHKHMSMTERAAPTELYAALNGYEDAVSETLTYFRPDAKKSGGAYLTLNGKVSDIDEVGRIVIMESGARIPVTDILVIDIG